MECVMGHADNVLELVHESATNRGKRHGARTIKCRWEPPIKP